VNEKVGFQILKKDIQKLYNNFLSFKQIANRGNFEKLISDSVDFLDISIQVRDKNLF
jgi:hypothetical protein